MRVKKFFQLAINLIPFVIFSPTIQASQIAWYVTFSGESAKPINNIYSLSVKDGSLQGEVVPATLGLHELRNMLISQDGKLLLLNSNKNDSRIVQFGPINKDGLTRNFIGNVVTTATAKGMIHPFFMAYDANDYLYISVQDTNIVLRLNGSKASKPWTTTPVSSYLQKLFPAGEFYPGTFVGAATANIAPKTPVPTEQGGLSMKGNNSVRSLVIGPDNIFYVADEGKDRITMYDSNGNYLGNITDANLGKPDELLYHAADNAIYISSPSTECILRYDLSTKIINTFIHDPSRLADASGIAFGEDGNFYVANRKTMSVYRYTAKGSKPVLFAGPFSDSPEGLLPVLSNK